MAQDRQWIVKQLRSLVDELEVEVAETEESEVPFTTDLASLAHGIAWAVANLTGDWPRGPIPSTDDILKGAGGPPAQLALRVVLDYAEGYVKGLYDADKREAFARDIVDTWVTINDDFWTEGDRRKRKAKRSRADK